jgi:hypothetical protein
METEWLAAMTEALSNAVYLACPPAWLVSEFRGQSNQPIITLRITFWGKDNWRKSLNNGCRIASASDVERLLKQELAW